MIVMHTNKLILAKKRDLDSLSSAELDCHQARLWLMSPPCQVCCHSQPLELERRNVNISL